MQRRAWEFEYTASKIAEAARAKVTLHRRRLGYYIKTKDALMEQIKAEGLEIIESVSRYSTIPDGPTIAVRNDLQKQLQDCVRKEQEHQESVLEYQGWVQVLEANPESRFKLDHEDWLYFFGARTVKPEPLEE